MQKVLLTALLFCWPLSAYGETSAEIKYFPAHYIEELDEQLNESYSLALRTDTTKSSQAPKIRLSLQCSSGDQDYFAGIMLDVINPDIIPVETVLTMFGPFEGEFHPVRFTGNNLDISPSWQWIYFERDNNSGFWPLFASLDHDPATLAQISNSLKGGWLRIEVFGFVYDFDLTAVRSTITGFHQKCAVVHGG
ncbi:MAG: hypothetical protein IH995_06240 [Proteobacteria bacterium]|nr:hypothetical protein [Pseudomonadota bacterium]